MSRKTLTLHSSLLFDPRKKAFVKDVSIKIDRHSGGIADVYERASDDEIRDGDIDLRGKVVMPGFVDAHTHIFLHPYSERPAAEQMRDESIVERTVRATNHVREALLSGYTTYRDLGTEAMENFDANLRDCINRGLIPGPRLFVATHALASTSSYDIRSENRQNGLKLPQSSDAEDGPWGLRRAVRRRIGDGADVIKFYADYRRKVMRFPPLPPAVSGGGPGNGIRFPPTHALPNPAVPLFSQEEMNAIVEEARLANLPVAAHAGSVEGATMAVRAGVTSVEHANENTDELWEEMVKRGVIYVPTLAILDTVLSRAEMKNMQARVKKAFDMGVRFAAGGDTGTFAHGEGVREMELLREAGIPLEDVLEACFVGGWEACGKDLCGYRFGFFEKGARADIIALDTDPREDEKALRKVSFVMKDGEVYKQGSVPANLPGEHRWTDAKEEEVVEEEEGEEEWLRV
ncbi:midohydrolase domain containing protein [Diaporthe amygdali]|uniref:midohydrolase domain containing protein n=1 Tax=Phomopsis amygdali TaxID=1214568 RepID=UPI0022FF3AF4|nr:midohydrolase domain containing protein [Diaporthe amygdali]KAJ0123311.1 midohydrolase domain containing protein [Diaporthe amygdali]